jgi:IS5 family transposase
MAIRAHLGDVLVLVAAAAIAAVLTWLLLRKPCREHRRSDVQHVDARYVR